MLKAKISIQRLEYRMQTLYRQMLYTICTNRKYWSSYSYIFWEWYSVYYSSVCNTVPSVRQLKELTGLFFIIYRNETV